MKTIRLFHVSPILIILLLSGLSGAVGAEPQVNKGRSYLPIVTQGMENASICDLPKDNYASLSVQGSPQKGDPETDEDMNLAYRGYAREDAARSLVKLGPVWDKKAPQFPGMFADRRTPRMSNTYQRYRWDSDCDCRKDTYSPYDTTVLGLVVKPGETIYTPDSGYDIGSGYEYQVMYAGDTGITLYIGRDDDFHGYVVHIEDVCVDPDLLKLYRKLHQAGRKSLPVLRGHQPFGAAFDDEITVAVRDSGHFLDPRSRNDWWQGR